MRHFIPTTLLVLVLCFAAAPKTSHLVPQGESMLVASSH